MNGNSAVLDTNIVLAILQKNLSARSLGFNSFAIFFVSELELLSYSTISHNEESDIRLFLAGVDVIDINPSIKDITISLRKQYKLKLPDAIIIATAAHLEIPLLTRDLELQKIKEHSIITL